MPFVLYTFRLEGTFISLKELILQCKEYHPVPSFLPTQYYGLVIL